MLVLRAVVDQKQESGCGQALHQTVQEGLGLGINPVQVLEHQAQRLHLAFAQQQTLDGLQRALAALRGIERLPLWVLDRYLQQRQKGRQRGLQGTLEREEPAGNPLAPRARVVMDLDAEIGLEEVDDREIGGGLAIRDRAARQQEPPVGAV